MTGISKPRIDRVSATLAKVAISARSAVSKQAVPLEPGAGTLESPHGGFVFGVDGLALATSRRVPQGRYLLLADPDTDGRVIVAAAGISRLNGQGDHTRLAPVSKRSWRGVLTVPADGERIWLLFDIQGRNDTARPSLRLISLPDALWRRAGPRMESHLRRSQTVGASEYELWRFSRLVEAQASQTLAQERPPIDVIIYGNTGDVGDARATALSLLGQSAAPNKVIATTSFASLLEPWIRQALEARCALEISERPGLGGNRVVALRSGDRLTPDAIARYAGAAAERPDAQLIYADHDLIDTSGAAASPFFKPAFSPLLLLSHDYLSRSSCLGAEPATHALAGEHIDPSSLSTLANSAELLHIPRILHHLSGSDELGAARSGCELMEYAPGYADRFFGVKPARETAPRASVLIPTAARPEIVRRCIESILSLTDHPDFEVLLDVNGPRAEELSKLALEMGSKGPVRMVESSAGRYDGFNFAALINGLAAQASGEHLVILNDDTEVLSPRWLRDLCCYLERPGIGAVGAKLLYPGGERVQHAGMVLGVAGVAAHCFVGEPGGGPGYQGYLVYPHETSALTGAALAMRSELFARLGGMDEAHLAVSYNDVDLCLRAMEAGYVNVLAPEAMLIHHETVTRARPTSGPALDRERAEVAYMRARWKPEILEADPYYNPNLTLVYERLFTPDLHPRPRGARTASLAPITEPPSI